MQGLLPFPGESEETFTPFYETYDKYHYFKSNSDETRITNNMK